MIPNHRQELSSDTRPGLNTLYRHLVTLNIAVQMLFPLAAVFTPVMVAASDKAAEVDRTLFQGRTRPLTLLPGESVHDIAHRYHLTVVQLKKLNQFRTFTKPFEKLLAGDEIDVPADGAAKKAPPEAAPVRTENLTQHWLLQQSTSLAQATTGPHHAQVGDAALSQARSTALSGGEAAVSEWLNLIGTARVQLGLDPYLALNDSALDLLVPLYDGGHDVLFVQSGGRRHDGRNTLNAGAGVRLFRGHWMYGTNVFFDNDITGNNHRVGVGAEAWTDYLKFSVNSYFGMTGWHQSRDFEDYDERPADGFDLTASGWLPAYSNLGGTLKYEQYQGEKVGLLGKNTLERNPKAVTAGLNWTPVPLVTLGTDYRKSGSQDELQMQAQFSWRFGEPLADQLSGDKVGAAHTLAGSRLNLVERNNNIVLDYRKQQVIQLSLPDTVRGHGLSVQLVNAAVTAKYGLDAIDWQCPDLVAAGGSLTQVGTQSLQLQLPAYQAGGVNEYVLHAMAKDARGNLSPAVDSIIIVDGSGVSASNSSMVFSLSQLPADGVSTTKITLMIKDAQGSPVPGLASGITLPFTFAPFAIVMNRATPGGKMWEMLSDALVSRAMAADVPPAPSGGGVKISDIKETRPGIYEAMLTAGLESGTVTMTPQVGNVTLAPRTLVLGGATDNKAAFGTAPASVTLPADGQTTGQLVFSVHNSLNHPLGGALVQITVDGKALPEVKSTAAGEVTVLLPASATPGDTDVVVTLDNKATQMVVVHYAAATPAQIAGSVAQASSTLTIDKPTIAADDTETATVTFTAKDSSGKAVTGLTASQVKIEQTGLTVSHFTLSAVTGSNGVFTATLKGDLAGTAAFTVKAGGTDVTPTGTHTVTLNATPAQIAAKVDKDHSTLTIDKTIMYANNIDTATITFTARDKSGAIVNGIPANMISFQLHNGIGLYFHPTGINGVFTATMQLRSSEVVMYPGQTDWLITVELGGIDVTPPSPIRIVIIP